MPNMPARNEYVLHAGPTALTSCGYFSIFPVFACLGGFLVQALGTRVWDCPPTLGRPLGYFFPDGF